MKLACCAALAIAFAATSAAASETKEPGIYVVGSDTAACRNATALWSKEHKGCRPLKKDTRLIWNGRDIAPSVHARGPTARISIGADTFFTFANFLEPLAPLDPFRTDYTLMIDSYACRDAGDLLVVASSAAILSIDAQIGSPKQREHSVDLISNSLDSGACLYLPAGTPVRRLKPLADSRGTELWFVLVHPSGDHRWMGWIYAFGAR